MKCELVTCDMCGAEIKPHLLRWDEKPSHVVMRVPPDGINGGEWSMDVCCSCRMFLCGTIKRAIDSVRIDNGALK